MKFFHLSDLHFGKQLHGYDLYLEQRNFMSQLCNYLKLEKPDAVLISGDIYDKSVPASSAVSLLDELLVALEDVTVLIIAGNHDSAERLKYGKSFLEKHDIHISVMPPQKEDDKLEKIVLKDEYGKVSFYMLPFLKPSMVRHFMPVEASQGEQAVIAKLLANEDIDYSGRNVILTHQFYVNGTVMPIMCGSELRPVSAGGTDAVDISILNGFDYAALGHIHSTQYVKEERFRYCGTPLKYSMNKSLEAVEKELLLSVEAWEKSRRKHEDYNRMYIACQSAFLAERLVSGKPCPVCGSESHPHMAQMPEDAVTADMVKRALTKEKKCEEYKDTIQKKAESLQSALAAEKAVLDEYAAQLFDTTYALASASNLIEEKEILLSAKKNNILEKINELEIKDADRDTRQKELEKLTKKQNKITSSIEKMEQEMRGLELKAEGLKKEAETLRASLEYDTKEEAEKNLKECETKLSMLEKSHKDADAALKNVQKNLTSAQGELKEAERQTEEYLYSLEELLKIFENTLKENGFESASGYRNAIIDAKTTKVMEDEIKAYKENCIKAHTGIQTILEQLDNTNKTELDGLERQLDGINTLMSGIKIEIDRYNFCIQSNNKTVERVNTLMQERGSITERLKVVKSLNEAANGKVHFQTYIQRQYFKQIIQAANTRLAGMVSGKFLLKCRDIGTGGQGETGLELDVYNPLTGKSRDAHTLSGGETFMASLSMALGMADIVQNTVGKTKLNTMFIDEGFGSLSDDVRNNAVSVLLELAGNNRLVGVISHVSELKEQIPNKLIVTKGNNGSSVKWEE